MAKQITINVVTRTQDNGDGGYTTYAYNNENELIANHPKAQKFTEIAPGKWDYVTTELTEQERHDILVEDDPYENGYIGRGAIVIDIDDDGNAKLAKPLSFHAGQ